MMVRDKRSAYRICCLLMLVFGLAPLSFATNDDDDIVVEGQILVELVPGTAIETILLRYDLTLIDGIDLWLLYQVEVNPPDTVAGLLPILLADPEIDDAEPLKILASPEGVQETIADLDLGLTPMDYVGQPATTQVETSGPAAVYQNGSDVVVAVLDTSFDLQSPQILPHLYSLGVDIRGDLSNARFRANGIDDDLDGLIDEAAHHGSYVAGLISLVAPMARILPIRVLDEDGQGTSFDLASGILYAIDRNVDVINLSLVLSDESKIVRNAIRRAEELGITIVVPTGNLGLNEPEFPATMEEVISVGSVDENGLRSAFSSYGEEVDVVAPGEALISVFGNEQFANWSGTSFAVPWVSGAVALLLDRYPSMLPSQVRYALVATAQPVAGSPSANGQFGHGMVSAEAIGGFLRDDWKTLKVSHAAGVTRVRWSRVLGANQYSLIRGDLAQLGTLNGQVLLGNVTCMAQPVLSVPVASVEDLAIPAAGEGYFYLVGDHPLVVGYGKSSLWEPRVATAGGCAP